MTVEPTPIDPAYYDCDRCGEDTCVESWGDDGTYYLSCGECGAVYDVHPPQSQVLAAEQDGS